MRMTTRLALLGLGPLLGLGTFLAGAASAEDFTAGSLKIGHPWSRATPNGAKVAGGYLTVTNTGSEADTLTGGTFDASGAVELHVMSMEGGVMKMAPVEGGLAIKPGETVTLKPGGYHLMFTGLKQGLTKGETVKGTLTFAKAGPVPVTFTVESLAAKAPGDATEKASGGSHHH